MPQISQKHPFRDIDLVMVRAGGSHAHGLGPKDFNALGQWYGEGDSNPHDRYDLWILSPVRLPIPPSPHGHLVTVGSQCGSDISLMFWSIKQDIEATGR